MRPLAKLHPSYDDLLALPSHQVGEIINDVLYVHPRPAVRHARAASTLGARLEGHFGGGDGDGPEEWVFLDEPELHLGRQILVPDIAGWRRERLPSLPDAPFLTVAPDWACEVLSPSTEGVDRSEKLPVYARHGVAHVWLINPSTKSLEVLRLDGLAFRPVATYAGDETVHVEPFDALGLALRRLWRP